MKLPQYLEQHYDLWERTYLSQFKMKNLPMIVELTKIAYRQGLEECYHVVKQREIVDYVQGLVHRIMSNEKSINDEEAKQK